MAAVNSKTAVAAAAIVAAVLIMAASEASAALTCGQVASSIAQCVTYAEGKTTTVSSGCCSGVRSLNGLARSTADRRQACKCLKQLAGTIKKLDMGKVSGVPAKCGVSVPFPISLSTNCDTIR